MLGKHGKLFIRLTRTPSTVLVSVGSSVYPRAMDKALPDITVFSMVNLISVHNEGGKDECQAGKTRTSCAQVARACVGARLRDKGRTRARA